MAPRRRRRLDLDQGSARGLGPVSGRPAAGGVVAAGDPMTAAAAAEILRDGGNAFDAALAGLAAACVAEPILCSLGGGGFLLARPADGEAALFDFFTQTPKRKRATTEIDFRPILADFGPATQEFHIGLGAVATPGMVKGIFAVHGALGGLPIARIFEPAIAMARRGVELSAMQAYVIEIVRPIVDADPVSRALFASPDRPGAAIGAGERFAWPALAELLEILAGDGEQAFYRGDIASAIVEASRTGGGHLTAEDLSGYRVERRRPLDRRFAGARILTNPPPSAGGLLIAFALDLLGDAGPAAGPALGPEHMRRLARAMRLTNAARGECGLAEDPGEAAARLGDPDLLARYRAEIAPAAPAHRGTTQISVIDGAGNAASLSVSNGEGCGVMPGALAGMMLNNMLGEDDVNPRGFHNWPVDSRQSSMMAPTLVIAADGGLTALGSGGSNRIRSAILQVLVNLLAYGLPLVDAVAAPRLHMEGDVLNVEAGLSPAALEAALAEGAETRQWPDRNLFFGGVHAVSRRPGATPSGAGDPRRGGVALRI